MAAPVAGEAGSGEAVAARLEGVAPVSKSPIVRIGARGSKLSLTQAGHIQQAIAKAIGCAAEDAAEVVPIVVITTTGDRVQDRRLLEVGGKALFTKEIEEAMLEGRVDCAVHSMKDVPAARQPGLVIAAVPLREDPRDAFLSLKHASIADLPQGARLGTASLRRQAQALHVRPDLDVVLMRGNVDTRLAKLAAGDADAMLLALAGLKRLGLQGEARSLLDPFTAPPAPGQGALAIETREDMAGADWVRALNHGPSALTVAAERGALEALEGSCRTAMGAYARIEGGMLKLIVEALTPDGTERFRREGEVSVDGDVRALGRALGEAVKAEGGDRLVLE
jgi:hydroxymethylbilane synthase